MIVWIDFDSLYEVKDARLEREVFGIKFKNPVGLAAGFDKDAKLYQELSNFGFGFIEIGTLTPVGQEGNPKKRLFRLKEDNAIINRMGFNNGGVKEAVERLKQNKGVLVFSLEMSNSQIFQRLLAIESKIPLGKIRNGFIDEHEWGQLGIASGKLANSNIQIADVPNVTVLEIRAMARRVKASGKLDMILIDYLQLIKGVGKGDNRQQEISDISRSLKGIARELNVPVIALSQLSRAPEQRADRRPMLSDLRDSGAIEQDADMVVFLYRDEYYNEDSEFKGIAEVIIGKQRNGPVGTCRLTFLNEFTKFADYTDAI